MTDKEKYNNKSTIDISTLSEDEVKTAIREWAEGDIYLEEFLWKCYIEGVETRGSNKGPGLYMDFSADLNVDKLKKIINSIFEKDRINICIDPDGGSCFSGNTFYKALININFMRPIFEEEDKEIFKTMTNSFNNSSKNNVILDSLIDLCNFFNQKESDYTFRYMNGTPVDYADNFPGNKQYRFITYIHGLNNYEYRSNLLEKLGLIHDGKHRDAWYIESDNYDDFVRKLEIFKNEIINQYDIELPTSIEDDMSLDEVFRVLRRKYIEKYGDDSNFNDFLNSFALEFNKKENQYFNSEITMDEFHAWVTNSIYLEETKLGRKK